MINSEKILKGWERCKICNMSLIASPDEQKAYFDCEYTIGIYCGKDKLIDETIALLKEREVVKPVLVLEGINKHFSNYVCPGCDEDLTYGQNYCSECGRLMKWE